MRQTLAGQALRDYPGIVWVLSRVGGICGEAGIGSCDVSPIERV
jgi:hypothetical protein